MARWGTIVAGGAAVLAGLAGGGAVGAQAKPFAVSPDSGPVGTAFVGAQAGESACPSWYMHWDAPPANSTPDTRVGVDVRRSAMTVPAGAAPGVHTVTAYCSFPSGETPQSAVLFRVVPPPATTTATTVPPAPPAPPVSPPPTSAPVRPPTTTTPSTSTTAPTTTSTTTPTTSTTAPPAPPRRQGSALGLDRPSVAPGGTVTARGAGCRAEAPVSVAVAGTVVGRARADDDGRFAARLSVPRLPLGRYRVSARCGPVLGATLDLVRTARVASAPSPVGVVPAVVGAALLLGVEWRRGRR